MSDLEALGDAATGAVIAGAVEPKTGQDGHTQEGNCLNCGTRLAGDYCHACGQRAHVHRTLGAFWHDLVHGVLHFEGKIWQTLPLLAWKPGELTRRYIHGERARFVSPIALFLFSVFLMFAVFSLLGAPVALGGAASEQARAEAERDLAAERTEARRDIAELQKDLAEARAARRPTAAIQSRITARQQELAVQETAVRMATGVSDRGDDESEFNVLSKTGWPALDRAVSRAESNPSLLLYKVQTNAYKFSWVLIPISLPFVWLLFLHRRRYRQEYGAYDHLIFVTYSIAFMSLGAIVLAVLRSLGLGGLTGLAATFIPPLHVYRQLRGAYRLSRWSAVWRTAVLIVFAFIALALFLVLLLVLGVLG
jgi:hypothetical protein